MMRSNVTVKITISDTSKLKLASIEKEEGKSGEKKTKEELEEERKKMLKEERKLKLKEAKRLRKIIIDRDEEQRTKLQENYPPTTTSSSIATKTISEETKKEEGGWQEGNEEHKEMLASELTMNLLSPKGKPILAIAVRRVASYLNPQGDNGYILFLFFFNLFLFSSVSSLFDFQVCFWLDDSL